MIFYVYIEPQIILDASNKGTHALLSLIGILRNFLQNCFVAEFEDYRTQHAIGNYVRNLDDSQSKTLIQSLFKQIRKRRLFIYCLIPDYSGEKKDIDCAVEQASSSLLDLLFIADNREIEELSSCEIATLETYQFTNFESSRSKLAQNGKVWIEGTLQNDFLDENFKKALRFAEEIIICDMILGRKFAAENFMYTILTMSQWLGKVLPDPFNLKKLFVHCEKPKGKGDDHVKRQLKKIKRGRLSNLEIEIDFYKKIGDRSSLPHDRFILTNQVAFFVGRGMDFLCKKTQTNRDVTINYLNIQELHKFLKYYSPNLVDKAHL